MFIYSFVKAGMNIIDMMGVLPYFMSLMIRYIGERWVFVISCWYFMSKANVCVLSKFKLIVSLYLAMTKWTQLTATKMK